MLINQKLREKEKNLSVVYTTILESHLQYSSILKNSGAESVEKKLESMNLKRKTKHGNYSANHFPLPVIEPPKTSHEFTEMWFDILRKRREDIPTIVNDSNSFYYQS